MTQKELILLETEGRSFHERASMKELLKVLPRVMILSVVGNRMGKVSPIPNELLSYLWEWSPRNEVFEQRTRTSLHHKSPFVMSLPELSFTPWEIPVPRFRRVLKNVFKIS